MSTGTEKIRLEPSTGDRLHRGQEAPGLPWTVTKVFVFLGVIFLAWQGWTMAAWLADNPHMVRPHENSPTWWAPHVLEALVWLLCLPVIIYLVRGCIKQRKVFTFDVMFCLAAGTMFWGTVGVNFFRPFLQVNSNFINLNTSVGHMPFVVNPDGGRCPDPIFWTIPCFAFLLLGVALAANRWLIPPLRRRNPDISDAKLLLVLAGCGLIFGLSLEVPAIALGWWNYPGVPSGLALPLGEGKGYPLVGIVGDMAFFSLPAMLWILRDHRGDTYFERAVRHLPQRAKSITIFLALYGFMQVMLWVVTIPSLAQSFYLNHVPAAPTYLVNDACNTPGIVGTRYGPCPGSPGFRAPERHSLPGTSP